MKFIKFIYSFSFWTFFLSSTLMGKTIEICPTCPIQKIETGLKQSKDCDTLLLRGGHYEVENLAIRKSITLLGVKNPTIISKSGDEILTLIADGITVKGLTLKNVRTSYLKERAAIRVKRKKHFWIEGNTIIDCFFGIYLEHAKSGTITGNTLSGDATTEAESGNAIHAWYCDKIEIYNNNLKGHRDGIYFEFVNNSFIRNNHSEHNKRYGLHFMFSNDDVYTDNTFKDNGVGVAVMFSRRIQMARNYFGFNWGRASYGLLLKEINDANIFDNTFEQNTIGVFVEGSNRIKYYQNTFERNGWGIKFSGGCSANEITHNNFLHNSLDLVVNTQLNDNLFIANYWSGYTGYDLDKNGIGDIPHYPVKLFSYILNEAPEAIILLRSLFVDIINFSEKVSPVFTPKEVMDKMPAMSIFPDKSQHPF